MKTYSLKKLEWFDDPNKKATISNHIIGRYYWIIQNKKTKKFDCCFVRFDELYNAVYWEEKHDTLQKGKNACIRHFLTMMLEYFEPVSTVKNEYAIKTLKWKKEMEDGEVSEYFANIPFGKYSICFDKNGKYRYAYHYFVKVIDENCYHGFCEIADSPEDGKKKCKKHYEEMMKTLLED